MRRFAVLSVGCVLAGTLLSVYMSAQAGPVEHRWHADYTLEYVGPVVQGDAIVDGSYGFTYAWNFGILNDQTAPFGPSRILVTSPPSLTPIVLTANPGVQLDTPPSPPDHIWSVPQVVSGGSFFGRIRAGVGAPAPSPHALGFAATRALSGGLEIGAGLTEQRTFTLTLTPTDPTLTNMQASVSFSQPTPPGVPPPVVTVENTPPNQFVCVAASTPDTPLKPVFHGAGHAFWEATGPTQTLPLPAGIVYTLTCTLTLTNHSTHTAWYTPSAYLTGARTAAAIETLTSDATLTTNPLVTPSDPLGTVRFEVGADAGESLRAMLDTRFARTALFAQVNSICTSTVRIIVGGVTTEGPMQLTVDGDFSVSLPGGITEFSGIETGTYHLVATPPEGLAASPPETDVTVSSCGQVQDVAFTLTDAAPPTIESVTPSSDDLWPPTNQMVPVTIDVSATDNVDPAPVCAITGVTSNDAGGWQFDPGSLTVQLRAEIGRVYEVVVTCTDEAGNSAMSATTVRVSGPSLLGGRGRGPR